VHDSKGGGGSEADLEGKR